LLGPAPGRPPILALTTSRSRHLGILTASCAATERWAVATVATGGRSGFGVGLAQGRRHAWLATTRVLGGSRRPYPQALLFRSAQ
jgi:hypothetical protein